MKKKKSISRREAVQALMISPLGIYLSGKLAGYNFIANSLATDLSNEMFLEYKLINFSMNGAAPRYYWDLPLKPNGASDRFEANPFSITKYGQNIQGPGVYEITQMGDYYFPSIWASDIPTPNGRVSMKALSNNMLTIRGIVLSQDGHAAGRAIQMIPVAGSSLLGVNADRSKLPLPAFGSDLSLFISQNGKTMTNGFGDNMLYFALKPFLNSSNYLSVHNTSVEAGIDSVLNILKQRSSLTHKFLPTSYEHRINAKKMMKREFGNLTDIFSTLESKYENLIQKSYHDTSFNVVGVEDRPIPGDGSVKFSLGGTTRYNGSDLRSWFGSNATIISLSQIMAGTEFMIKEGYTSTTSFSFSRTSGLNRTDTVDPNGVPKADALNGETMLDDNHYIGSHPALIFHTKYFKAVSACYNELIEQLKNKTNGAESLFDRSIVTCTGDFGRNGRQNGSGSDHGFNATNYTIFSGMVPKLTVIGNTTEYVPGTPEYNRYGGSWGVGAPVQLVGGRELNMGNVASTIATMMDFESITPNDTTLVKKENGIVTSLAEAPKNIAPHVSSLKNNHFKKMKRKKFHLERFFEDTTSSVKKVA